ncbi:DUF397 domain-containing protein [Micromonospora sp. WMMD737]|uniref:DUF397 domain-containing protein n=1 Tax=Micromonospora sp. WMMD737 TaxID=3404113 RepID=UPI003B9649E4
MTDLTGAVWRKSTRSGDNGGDCVEVATNLPGVVAIRDSKDAQGPVVTIDPPAWFAFMRDLKAQRLSTDTGVAVP